MNELIGKRVRVRYGNKQPAYNELYGVITWAHSSGKSMDVRLDGYGWDVAFGVHELEFTHDPLPLPG